MTDVKYLQMARTLVAFCRIKGLEASETFGCLATAIGIVMSESTGEWTTGLLATVDDIVREVATQEVAPSTEPPHS